MLEKVWRKGNPHPPHCCWECKSVPPLWKTVFCCSFAQSYLTLCDPLDCSMPGLPVPHHLLEFAQVHVNLIGEAIQPSHLLSPLLLLPSFFPSIRVFSNESAIHIRWPKYWSFSLKLHHDFFQ